MSYNINNVPVDNSPGLVIQQDKQEEKIEITITPIEDLAEDLIEALKGAVDAKQEKDNKKEEDDAISKDLNEAKVQADKD